MMISGNKAADRFKTVQLQSRSIKSFVDTKRSR